MGVTEAVGRRCTWEAAELRSAFSGGGLGEGCGVNWGFPVTLEELTPRSLAWGADGGYSLTLPRPWITEWEGKT